MLEKYGLYACRFSKTGKMECCQRRSFTLIVGKYVRNAKLTESLLAVVKIIKEISQVPMRAEKKRAGQRYPQTVRTLRWFMYLGIRDVGPIR